MWKYYRYSCETMLMPLPTDWLLTLGHSDSDWYDSQQDPRQFHVEGQMPDMD